MYQTLDELEKNANQEKPSKRKKWVKRSLITLSLIILFLWLCLLSIIIIDKLVRAYPTSILIPIIFSLLISLFTEILIVYLITLLRTRKFWWEYRLKRHLKISLYVLLPFLFIITLGLLTIAWTIPNRFNLEVLESYYCWPQKKYNWKDEECYQKCKDWCTYEGCHVMGVSCSEDCDQMCNVPRYENCISKCKKPKIDGYDKKNYNLWHEQQSKQQQSNGEKFEEKFRVWTLDMMHYYWNYDIVLMGEGWYNEWINEKFSWHVDELKKYESCLSTCWSAPGYIPYHKPIIYLYPTTETEVNVELWIPENLSHTYPKYDSEKWRNVIAQPNGDLEDINTWRKLYALYREWESENKTNFDEWFVVAWKDIISFLEEKLVTLWLNEREAEEFIVYWLPQMEDNEWNLIRFESVEEQNKNMPLNITPTPDTVIRVMMDWKTIDEPIDIPEQKLTTPERNWFTVVEWWWSPRN